MKFSQVALAAVVAGTTSAAPLQARAINDGDILNYALTLEHLEDKFYRDGLSKFKLADFKAAGFDETFYNNLHIVSKDESTHVAFLTAALQKAKVTPVAECTYDFGYKDVAGFIATASILEGVGVSAYLGAAADIMNKDYLTAAGSILTVESRHSSYLRAGLKEVPFAQPFDTPLTFDEVYTLASQFIKGCPPGQPKLPVKAFPTLTLDASIKTVKSGDTITLDTSVTAKYGQTFYAAFISVTGPTFAPVKAVKGGYQVVVPAGFAGQSYVVLTDCNTSVSDDTTVAGPAIVEIVYPSS